MVVMFRAPTPRKIAAMRPPSILVDVRDRWMFMGDSQTGGRDVGAAKSHVTAFTAIWARKYPGKGPANPYGGLPTNPYQDGVSGRSLAGTITQYNSRPDRLTATWYHLQESGNQLGDGGSQDTPAKYKALYKAHAIQVEANSPGVVQTKETAFSFGRTEAGRVWDAYNAATREAVAELKADRGITVRIVETDRDIKLLQALLTPAAVWFQRGEANEYHYRAPGNLMIALSTYKALGETVTLEDMADIVEVSDATKQKCLDVMGANP
jgi:hypothetical protein